MDSVVAAGSGTAAGVEGNDNKGPSQFMEGDVVKDHDSREKSMVGTECGWWCCLPKWLQFFNTPRWFLFCLCMFALLQSMTVNGVNSVVIPTIERRYRLSSQRSGLIASGYDISSGILIVPISYFGERAHKPRWLGLGCLVLGVGSLLFTLPQFITGQFQPDSLERLEYCGVGVNHTSYLSDCQLDSPGIYALLVIAQVVIGIGALPLYTLGLAYLDEIAKPKYVSYYIGLFYTFAGIGPALGFLLSSAFLSQYVDPGVADPPDAKDPNFVGRWWTAYVVTGFASVLLSIPLLLFPKQLPGTAWIMEEKRKTQKGTGISATTDTQSFGDRPTASKDLGTLASIKTTAKEFVVMVKLVFLLLLTPVLLTNTLAATCEAFAIQGFLPFATKYFETQFGVTASVASLLAGAMAVVGVVGGILCSSWLMKRSGARGARMAQYTAVIAGIAACFALSFLVRCEAPPVIGATRPYEGSTITGSNRCKTVLNETCFSSCGCVSERYDPVCGSDGFTYPTPCLAGCQDFRNGTTASKEDRVYTDCNCIAASLAPGNVSGLSMLNATATVGVCRNSCSLIPLAVVLFTALLFTTFMNNVPAVQVVLQCVPANRRTVAIGVQWMIIRLLGTIPSPVFYGYLLDKSCRLWQLTCCTEGNCWEYDSARFSYTIFGLSLGFKSMAFIFFLLSWRFFVRDNKAKRELASKEAACT